MGLMYCAGGRAPHFPDPFRQTATAILLKRSNQWPRPPTLLATIAQVRQPPTVVAVTSVERIDRLDGDPLRAPLLVGTSVHRMAREYTGLSGFLYISRVR